MRQELTGERDLTYSRWHRLLSHEHTMIDLDAVEYCHIGGCYKPILFVETARYNGRPKGVTVLRNVAAAANVKAICVLYTLSSELCECKPSSALAECGHGIESFRVRRVFPDEQQESTVLTPQQFAASLLANRYEHLRHAHPQLIKAA